MSVPTNISSNILRKRTKGKQVQADVKFYILEQLYESGGILPR